MTSFKRARSEEQRAERRRVILETAGAMLGEMSVAQLSLNELSRRVGLAKSNVLNYFESREAVLLEILDAATLEWLGQLEGALAAAVDPAVEPFKRGDQVAATVAKTLSVRPVLCDLVSAQAAVLEHNVSPDVAAKYKRTSIANVGEFRRLILARLPELGERDAMRFAGAAVMVTGAVWSHARPSAAMLVVYERDPAMAAFRLDFAAVLRETLEVLISGLLARS